MIGVVGGVDDRRGSKGLAKWMGGGVHGRVMVDRELRGLWKGLVGVKQDIGMRVGQVVGSGGGEGGLR